MQQPDFTQHPAYMNVFPVHDSLVDAIAYIENQIPITSPNELFGLLMGYHNTLIKELCCDQAQDLTYFCCSEPTVH